MKTTLIYFMVIASLMLGAYINSITPKAVAYEAPRKSFPIIIESRKTWNDTSIRQLIHDKAKEYGVKESVMLNVIDCESYSSTTLQSYVVKNGVREDSWGIAQIHLPSHKDITKEQALDPEFAVTYMAKEMSEGRAYEWSCWKQIYRK